MPGPDIKTITLSVQAPLAHVPNDFRAPPSCYWCCGKFWIPRGLGLDGSLLQIARRSPRQAHLCLMKSQQLPYPFPSSQHLKHHKGTELKKMISGSDLEPLYRRAIANSESITRAERNAILGWPPIEVLSRQAWTAVLTCYGE